MPCKKGRGRTLRWRLERLRNHVLFRVAETILRKAHALRQLAKTHTFGRAAPLSGAIAALESSKNNAL